jgi:uncharacterized RDD family membrane protein YckC
MLVISATPGKKLGPWQAFLRSCGWWIGGVSLGAGWSTIISRADRRAWHDIVSETIVINPHLAAAHRPTYFERVFGMGWSIVASMVFIIAL